MSLVMVLAVCGLLNVACGSTSTHTTHTTASSCGSAYTFIAKGQRSTPPGCAGRLPYPTSKSVSVGERFSIEVATDTNGKLQFPIPQPAPHGPVRLMHQTANHVFYVATRPGVARLWAHNSPFCPNPKVRSCVVYRIDVG